MKNIYLKIITLITLIQCSFLSYVIGSDENDCQIIFYQNKEISNEKILFNKKTKAEAAVYSILENTEEQTTPASFSLSNAIVSFDLSNNAITKNQYFDLEETKIQKRILITANDIPTEIWVHISSYLYYPTSKLHQMNHYFFQAVTSYPVIALLRTFEYLQSLDKDDSEQTKTVKLLN